MAEIGVDNVANNPNLTFIFFIGLALLMVLGLRFAFYAHRNRAETGLDTQISIWRYLLYIGGFAAIYGLVGILEIVTTLDLPYKSAAMLALTLLLAFAIRQIHLITTSADGGAKRSHPFERVARAAFIGLVFLDVVVLVAVGVSDLSAIVEGVSAIMYTVYGVAFYHDQTTHSRVQGTMLDSLLRHLLPVMTFAALVNIVSLSVPLGLDRVVVLHVQVIFIIMTATALMTGTIKLRQNLAGL
ncbi:MAG: hypothetical protein V5A54_13590 [Haloarculaceae archaeon]